MQGEFVLTHPNVQIPSRGAIYSFNEANRQQWDAPLRTYIDDLQKGDVAARRPTRPRPLTTVCTTRTAVVGGCASAPSRSVVCAGRER